MIESHRTGKRSLGRYLSVSNAAAEGMCNIHYAKGVSSKGNRVVNQNPGTSSLITQVVRTKKPEPSKKNLDDFKLSISLLESLLLRLDIWGDILKFLLVLTVVICINII